MSKPEKKFQAGGIEASVFENEIQHEGRPIKIKKVAFQKRYKSANGWQTTYTLDLNDVPKAILVLQKAFEFMALNSDSSTGESERLVEDK
jgi:ribosomal protein L25 (general stress protein Ctc)